MRCLFVVGIGLQVAACGDGGAGGPTTPTSPQLTAASSGLAAARIVSGGDGKPVAGAQVRLGGQGYATDGNGEVMTAPGVGVPVGAEIDVDAPGFLPRRTRVPGDRLVTLWPVASDAEAEAVREMVYGGPRGDILLPTIDRLFSLSLSLDPRDPTSSDIKEVWTAEAVSFGVPFGLDYQEGAARPYETQNEIAVRFAETAGCARIPAWGLCLESASGTDMSFRVLPGKARDPQTIRRVVASWFLGPNPQRGLMNPDAPTAELSPLEAQTIRMIQQRPLPNRWPDTDR
jgi:hypothetical protein